MTSPFYRTMEMKGRDPKFMLAKFHGQNVVIGRLRGISFHQNMDPENVKSQKSQKIEEAS